MLNPFISFLKRKVFRISKDRWDYQYANGQWEALKTEEELQRIFVANDLLKKYHSQGNILEIGCGEGIFFQKISPEQYTFYEGIDISVTAIKKIPPSENSQFIAADMGTYQPANAPFGAIVLNEVLYYSTNPTKLLERYKKFLTQEGVFLIGMYDGEKSQKIWQNLTKEYTQQESILVKNKDKIWLYKVLKPLQK